MPRQNGDHTQNQLAVGEIIPFGDITTNEVIMLAGLACQAQSKDTIDTALLQYSRSIDIDIESHQCVSFTPFEPATKRSEAIIASGGKDLQGHQRRASDSNFALQNARRSIPKEFEPKSGRTVAKGIPCSRRRQVNRW